ncbi:hypothetical protein D9M72_643020 [compost metagenome]
MPNSRVNSGTVAIASAATPDATPQCSATVTPPLPQLSRRMPIIPPLTHSRAVGQGAPRQRIQANISAPATRKRQPAISIGGQDSTPTRIAR